MGTTRHVDIYSTTQTILPEKTGSGALQKFICSATFCRDSRRGKICDNVQLNCIKC